jgi:antitoxin HigA-1
MMANGSANDVTASSKETPCFCWLLRAFFGSQTYRTRDKCNTLAGDRHPEVAELPPLTKERTVRLPTHRAPTPPGEILLAEWLKPMKLTQLGLAQKMGVDIQLVNGIVNGRRSVTAKTALLLAKVLKTSPEFWLNAQMAWICGTPSKS